MPRAAEEPRGAAAPRRLKSSIETIHEVGCVVKDLDIGLVDFPTLFRGEEVYLCWKMGESSIQFWHGVDEGFAGQKANRRRFPSKSLWRPGPVI